MSDETLDARWPPPGLESIHGTLWNLIGGLGIGGVLMIAPLLWATAFDPPFSQAGSAQGSAWATLAAAAIDFFVLIEAYTQLYAGLRVARLAAEQGYGWRLIAHVAADGPRDAGFIMTGTRAFTDVDELRRRRILDARLFGSLAYLAGVLWLPIVFPLALLLALSGVLSSTSVWLLALLPIAVLLFAGFLMRSRENVLRRGVVSEGAHGDASHSWLTSWRRNVSPGIDLGGARPRFFSRARVIVLIGVLLLMVPMWFALDNTASTVLMDAGFFGDFGRAQRRFAAAEALRVYALPHDSSITPAAAAAALYSIAVSGEERDPLMRSPERAYPGWDGEFGSSAAMRNVRLSAGGVIWRIREDSLTGEQRAQIEQLARHPMLREFAITSRAKTLDLNSAAYVVPLPDTLSLVHLPVVPFRAVRNAANVKMSHAALLADAGRLAEAEREVAEVMSTGFLLMEARGYLITALVGVSLVEGGASALEAIYSHVRDTVKVQRLRVTRASGERAARIAQAGRSGRMGAAIFEQIPNLVLDRAVTPGLRWEMFTTLTTYVPCLNQHNVLFGPGRDYDEWVAQARAELVQSAADAEIFELVRNGIAGSREHRGNLCGAKGMITARRQKIF